MDNLLLLLLVLVIATSIYAFGFWTTILYALGIVVVFDIFHNILDGRNQ